MSLSNVISNYIKPIKEWYSEINSATLTGAIDVIVVEQPDGSYLSSPFHVRFGKLGVMKAREKIVDLEVNDEPVDIHMKLDDNGAAFFVEGCNEDREVIPPELATSPLPELHNLPPSWTKEDVEEASDERGTSSNSSRDQSRTRQVVQEPLEAVEATKKPSTRRKRKRKGKGHARGGSKSSMKDFTSGNDAPDDIFTMDDVVKEPQLGTSLPEDLAGTPTPTNPTQPAPFQKQVLSMSMPTSPVMIRPKNMPESDPATPTTLVPSSLSYSCSKLHETPEHPLPDAKNSFLLSRLPEAGTLDEILTMDQPKPQPSAKKSSMQYFSEPEMSPVTSPMGSRPGSPVLSDTEFESQRRAEEQQQLDENEQSWEWGKLPTNSPSTPDRAKSEDLKKDEEKTESRGWGLSYLWRGSGKQKAKEEAVYLEDLKDDEEMLKIYVGSHLNNKTNPVQIVEDDAESGNGPSLPMSPHSVEGAALMKYESEFALKDVDVSLCGGLNAPHGFSTLLFEQGKLSFDDFVVRLKIKDADLFNNPNLVVRIGEQYYTWQNACPIIMSKVLYGRSLPSDLVDVFSGSYQEPKCEQPEPEAEASATSAATTAAESTKRNSSWWPFGSKRDSGEPLKSGDVTPKEKEDLEEDSDKAINEAEEKEPLPAARKSRDAVNVSTSSDCSTGDEFLAVIGGIKADRYRKTLRLSNELITKLNLKSGANEVQFSVTTAFQGTTRCRCHVYLWKWTDKIVISDIDGTITKSDVLGHVMPIIGRDWAQSGVASLFTKIKNNGYHIAYLSARAIGQASLTKDYLQSVTQGDVNLPDGPLLLNPTSLVNAFHREVIIKKPEDFKIACLRDIQKLFPAFQTEEGNPFYAGYGNRVNDVWAYRAVQIPVSRVFTINPRGELRHALTQTYRASYYSQGTMVDHIFPPLDASHQPVNAYSTFSYWRDPLPEFDIENELKKMSEQASK